MISTSGFKEGFPPLYLCSCHKFTKSLNRFVVFGMSSRSYLAFGFLSYSAANSLFRRESIIQATCNLLFFPTMFNCFIVYHDLLVKMKLCLIALAFVRAGVSARGHSRGGGGDFSRYFNCWRVTTLTLSLNWWIEIGQWSLPVVGLCSKSWRFDFTIRVFLSSNYLSIWKFQKFVALSLISWTWII